MTTETDEKIFKLINNLNELILDDVRYSDEALMFKIKAIRLLMKANKSQSEIIFNYIDEYLS